MFKSKISIFLTILIILFTCTYAHGVNYYSGIPFTNVAGSGDVVTWDISGKWTWVDPNWLDADVSNAITLTNITQITNRAWTSLTGTGYRLLYTNSGGTPTELAFGAVNTFLKFNGVTSAPTVGVLIPADMPAAIDPDKIGTDTTSNNKIEPTNVNFQSADFGLNEGKFWIGSSANLATPVDAIDNISVGLGNGTDAITTGRKNTRTFCIPYKHDLEQVILTTNEVVGSMTIDIWIDEMSATTGLAAVADADSLFDTATEPAIADASADNHFIITSFDSGEAIDIPANSCYVINVDAAATLTYALITLQLERVD